MEERWNWSSVEFNLQPWMLFVCSSFRSLSLHLFHLGLPRRWSSSSTMRPFAPTVPIWSLITCTRFLSPTLLQSPIWSSSHMATLKSVLMEPSFARFSFFTLKMMKYHCDLRIRIFGRCLFLLFILVFVIVVMLSFYRSGWQPSWILERKGIAFGLPFHFFVVDYSEIDLNSALRSCHASIINQTGEKPPDFLAFDKWTIFFYQGPRRTVEASFHWTASCMT